MTCSTEDVEELKRGSTFNLPLCYEREISPDVWQPIDLTGATFRSQIRVVATGRLVAELDVVVNDALQGLATLYFDDTDDWPVERLCCDVKATWPNGFRQASQTILVDVTTDVTRNA